MSVKPPSYKKDVPEPTHFLIAACKNHNSQSRVFVEKLLTGVGCNVNGTDNDGRTPLMWACWNGQKPIVEILFSKGADVNMQDNDGKSALMFADENGHGDIVKILIERRATGEFSPEFSCV